MAALRALIGLTRGSTWDGGEFSVDTEGSLDAVGGLCSAGAARPPGASPLKSSSSSRPAATRRPDNATGGVRTRQWCGGIARHRDDGLWFLCHHLHRGRPIRSATTKNGLDARRRARTRRRGRVCVCASDGRGVAGDARRHEWRAAPGGGAALAARTGGVWGRGLATRERRGAGRARGGWWATHRDPEEVLPFGQRGTGDIMWRNVAYCGVI